MKNLLDNKVAIITGGTSGIGKTSAKVFADYGAKVTIVGRNSEAGNALAEEIKNNGGEAIFVQADLTKLEENQKVVDETLKAFGKLDIAFNNAGVAEPGGVLHEVDPASWLRTLEINLTGVFYSMKAQIPAMLENGGGSIINMSSVAGALGSMNASAYTASKHGVAGLTKTAAVEYGAQGIRVNSVGPGTIMTELSSTFFESEQGQAFFEMLKARHALKRAAQPEEVAEVAAWLGSDKASFVSGVFCPIDGGWTAH